MTPEWMNWEGWRWVSIAVAMLIGFYMGWDTRSFRSRLDAQLVAMKNMGTRAIVDQLASFTDPRDTIDNQDEEIEAFAAMIRKAKSLVGDLSPPAEYEDEEDADG